LKKILSVALAFICVVLLTCVVIFIVYDQDDQAENFLYMGLNVEIVRIDAEKQIIYVNDCDDRDSFFEKKSAIDCSKLSEERKLIYVDYDTNRLMYIKFSDLEVGDYLTVNVYADQLKISNNGLIVPEQIQLTTQQ